MARCEVCLKDYHFCGSCGTGHEPDEFFCSSQCEQEYCKQNSISDIGAFLAKLFGDHVPYEEQKKFQNLLWNISGDLDRLLVFQELRYASYTAKDPSKNK